MSLGSAGSAVKWCAELGGSAYDVSSACECSEVSLVAAVVYV